MQHRFMTFISTAFHDVQLPKPGTLMNITSVNFPQMAVIETNYIWHVQAPIGQRVRLVFEYAYAPYGLFLSQVPVVPGYGFYETSLTYFNDGFPSKIVTYDNDIWIVFQAYEDDVLQPLGFHIVASVLNITGDIGTRMYIFICIYLI